VSLDFNDPMRQCRNADGRKKRIFKNIEKAEKAAEIRGAKYHAYVCTFGHAHVGRRSWEPGSDL
jgi:hypothetical protein